MSSNRCAVIPCNDLKYVKVLIGAGKVNSLTFMKRKQLIISSETGDQPRVASLRNSSTLEHLCGATIINADFALTAAHCVSHQPDQYILQLNNICIKENATYPEVKVEKIVTHKMFNKHSRAHDIAILQISPALDGIAWLNDSVLPTSSFGLSGDCTIYGNGYTDPGVKDISKTLRAAEVKIISLDKCIELLGPYVAPESDGGMLCALGRNADSCQGDSGGPLICGQQLQGISSYGMGCGVQGLPGVYTSIGSHLSWIREVLQPRNKI